MRKIKILCIIFLVTLVFSSNHVKAGIYSVLSIQNKLVPGNGGGYQTATKYINEFNISHHVLRNVNISRNLDVILTKEGSVSTPSINIGNGQKQLTNNISNALLFMSAGNFYLTFRTKSYHFGDTTIYNLSWQTDDSLK